MSGSHFEEIATEYAVARPPYPDVVFDTLEQAGAIGPGRRVLDVGAGAGLATGPIVERGSEVVALEPGPGLAAILGEAVPAAEVVVSSLEEAHLAPADFDAVVSATAMHWVDLAVGLPKLHRTLRPGGQLAVWRTVFGDDTVRTDFRDRVAAIVAERGQADDDGPREARPTVAELTAGGWFEHLRSEHWGWSIDLDADAVGRLFRTFSDWTASEVAQAERAALDLGGRVTEHYQTVLHLLRRVDR
ncbi:class I SAM-dependent methyltransferase [Microbacterium sp. ARD31]|uniref:class I SAM-dependent methyltransferase n=1 Tax=Microbacterium sp. ARD31 TaxID=2962576 RepID=UPI002880DA27|nr:class I SAM-dependent methyltransferase [Microbacterium sp. ARD31]MDT0188326.1 class I SAM-dependent methyltransferase [Microbacterium sp. ARD31]